MPVVSSGASCTTSSCTSSNKSSGSASSSSGRIRKLLLGLFFMATPLAQYCVYVLHRDRLKWAIINGYAFSIPMVLLYLYPFFLSRPLAHRVKTATLNWIVWLSVFTEVVFQIPHNIFVKQLHNIKGSVIEWPFYSYGLSDSRWNDYHGGTGLAPEVWLINYNDAGLGVIVLLALLFYQYKKHKHQHSHMGMNEDANKILPYDVAMSKVSFILVVMFRDATLWRETVEYMYDHHRDGYPYTTTDETYRIHAIAILWVVNGVWLIAPFTTVVWGYNEIALLVHERTSALYSNKGTKKL